MAGVSAGTVDRVLHNRGRVSEEKQRRVEKVLQEVNYKPNKIARFLASKKNYKLAVIIPEYSEGEYWKLVASGIERAVEELKDFFVSVDYLLFDQHDSSSFTKLIDKLDVTEYKGAVIATLFKEQVIDLSKQFDRVKIPYVYIDSNLAGQKNLSYFGSDSEVSGSIAAKFMLKDIGDDGSIIIVHTIHSKKVDSNQIANRECGFLDYVKESSFRGDITHFEFNLNDKSGAQRELNRLLQNMEGAVGGVVFNSRIYEFVDLLKRSNYNPCDISLVGYDPIARNSDALESNEVKLIISQRSIQQGYESIKALSGYLIFETTPQKENYMPIDILIKENIKYYTD